MDDILVLDGVDALRTLKMLLEKQASELGRLAQRESELSEQISKLNQRAETSEERVRSLGQERTRLLENDRRQYEKRVHVLERERNRLDTIVKARDGAIKDLKKQLSDNAERLTLQANTAEERAQLLEARCAALKEKAEYGDQMRTAHKRLEDAEQRAQMFEARCDVLQAKADRHDRIGPACEKLLAALDQLPLSMKDAGIVPGAHRPEIALYGTYDWQHVMDAKFALVKAMKGEK